MSLRHALAAAAMTCALAFAAVPASADPETVRAADLELSSPWTRATAPTARVGAGYLTIRSLGAADRLTGGHTAAAEALELHTHEHDSAGVMRMRAVESIEIPAGGTVTLGPGGLHLMLVGLTAPLAEGDRVPVTLVFEAAGEVPLELLVAGAGARTHPAAANEPGHGGESGHGGASGGHHHRH